MMGPQIESVAEFAIGRILNSLPQGLLIALFTWVAFRLWPRHTAGTRFAGWFMALTVVVGLPLVDTRIVDSSAVTTGVNHPLLTIAAPWGVVLFVIWVAASATALLRLAAGFWSLYKLRRSCVTISPADLAPAVQATLARLNSARPVTLATSDQLSVPAALGFFRPVIVLPTWALRELPPEQLNIILIHELAHLSRWDDWTNLLQKFVRALFFFHPAVWWIDRRLSLEREMACDDRVLADTADPHAYAKCLVGILERTGARRGWALAQAVVHRAREASLRLARILDVNRTTTPHVWKPAIGLVGAFSVVCLVAMPRAPQFVAFHRNVPELRAMNDHPTLAAQISIATPTVIPAAVRTASVTPIIRTAKPVARPAARHLPKPRGVDPSMIAARWNPQASPAFLRTGADAVQPAETLLIIRTVQRVGPDSWVWSVGVWRVTLVLSPGDAAQTAPVSGKT